VWTHGLLKQLLEIPSPDPGSPYKALPKQANLRVAIRRTLRVGALAGTPVEDLGIQPTFRHQMSRWDVLENNKDLLARAGELLAARTVYRLEVDATLDAGGTLSIQLDVANLDRADIYVDGRPRDSIDLAGNAATVTVAGVPGAKLLRVDAFAGGQLAAARLKVL